MQQAWRSSRRKLTTLERHSVTASTPNEPWTGWEEGSHSLPAREVTIQHPGTLLALAPPPLKSKPRAILSNLIPRAYAKASRSAVSMTYRPTSRAIKPLKNILVSPKDKDPMENKSGAIYWFQC